MMATSYPRVAVPFSLMFISAVALLEYLFPWKTELAASGISLTSELESFSLLSLLTMKAWPPYVAGAIVGLLQVPAMLLLTVTLGTQSSTFATLNTFF